jgi:hypothetical protein
MLSNTKQESESESEPESEPRSEPESKPKMIEYLLNEKNFGNPKAINTFDDEHRTAVRMQKSLFDKQYRFQYCIASSRGLASANKLCEVVDRIWSEC